MKRGLLMLTVLTAAIAAGGAGCGDKTAAAGTSDPAALAAKLDGGAEGGHASGAGAAVDAGPSLEDVALPQAGGPELDARMRHLLEAIAQNNPDLAGDVLFPRDAYVATKDLSDPQKAWDKKVSGSFRRAVERTHKRTKGAEQARFVSFELGHSVMQITPKKKDWKRPLWRVKHSKLTFTIDGKTRHLDIAEMTAWRGAWYVTRLR
jgi:hypothetical protein